MTDNLREPVRDDNGFDAVQETVRPVPSSEDRGGSSEHCGALRGQDGTPMEHGSGPRGQDDSPIEHGGSLREQDGTPMEHGSGPRGQDDSPIEHGGSSRGHSSAASGPSGTEGPSGLPKEFGGGPTDPGGAPDNASAVHEPRDALQLIIDVILNPQAAFGYLGRRRHVGLAFLLAIAGSIVMTTASGPISVVDDLVDTSPGPGFVVFSAVLTGTIGLLVSSGFTHITARLLGGKNRYVFMLQAVGFTFLPYLLAAPFFVVHRVVDIHFIVRGVWFIANVWTIILYVLAIREVHSLSTGRAIAAFAIPIVILFGLVFTMTLFVLGALMGNF